MIDRLILSAVLGIIGWNGLFPSDPPPLTAAQLQVKAKAKQISALCDRKKKSKQVRKICKRWGQHDHAG